MAVSDDATVSSKGQVTIPKRIRDKLGIEAGTELEFAVEDDGSIRVRPKQPAMDRLRTVKETLSDYDVDVDEIRSESKTAWQSHFDEDDA